MTRILRPLLSGSTYAAALLAFGGLLVSLPLLPFAMIPGLLMTSAPEWVQAFVVLAVWAVLVGLVALIPGVRQVLVVVARKVLQVPLPDAARRRPPQPPFGGGPVPARPDAVGQGGADRLRTPAWLLLHVALGWVGTLLFLVLVASAVSLPGNWLDGDGGLAVFGWSTGVPTGPGSWVLALVCLLLALLVCAGAGSALRWLAPRLLGPSAAERLALAAERETRLAERNRLAHELHDSIGHTLTATTIQAAVADEVLSADPVAARAALRSIEESSRAALEDLDYVLGVLREEDGARTAPTRTLADVPELLDRLRHAGAVVEPELSVDLAQVHGTPSRAAYRILQEGLTNALRHGAGGPISVRVVATTDALELDVVNRTGTAARSFPTSGHGLSGLTERVRLLGGEITVGPDGPEHWRLAVRLPVRIPA